MPYGYTVGGELNATWQGRMDGKGAHVHLPEGPCRVSASWSGPEKAVLSLVRPDERVVLAEIPAQAGGGLAAHAWSPSALSKATGYAWNATRAPRPQRPEPSKSGLCQSATSPRGGGVDDHTARGSAGGSLVRGDQHRRKRCPGEKLVPGTSHGRVHHYGRLTAGRADGASNNRGRQQLPLSLRLGRRGKDGNVDKCCGTGGRNQVFEYLGQWLRRCGRDGNHLSAVTSAAGGGFVNDHPVPRVCYRVVCACRCGREQIRKMDENPYRVPIGHYREHPGWGFYLHVLEHFSAFDHHWPESRVRQHAGGVPPAAGSATRQKRDVQDQRFRQLLFVDYSASVGRSEGPVRSGDRHHAACHELVVGVAA